MTVLDIYENFCYKTLSRRYVRFTLVKEAMCISSANFENIYGQNEFRYIVANENKAILFVLFFLREG